MKSLPPTLNLVFLVAGVLLKLERRRLRLVTSLWFMVRFVIVIFLKLSKPVVFRFVMRRQLSLFFIRPLRRGVLRLLLMLFRVTWVRRVMTRQLLIMFLTVFSFGRWRRLMGHIYKLSGFGVLIVVLPVQRLIFVLGEPPLRSLLIIRRRGKSFRWRSVLIRRRVRTS